MEQRRKAKNRRKPYQPPRLVKYGDVARLTGAKGGTKGDGKNPPSKA